MPNASKIKAAAEALFADQTAREPYSPLSAGLRPNDLAQAYAAQDEFHKLVAAAGRGPLVGYKIALTSAAMQRMAGFDQPCAGALFADTVYPSPARLKRANYLHLGVECEMAVRLAADLPAAGAPYVRDKVAEAVADCLPAFELIEDRNADYGQLDALSLVVENCWNAGVVLGAATADWRDLDLVNAVATLDFNGETVDRGRTGDAMGHPFEVVAWLANHLAGRGRQLEAGMIVMTGSVVTTKFPTAGDSARFAIEGLGEVNLHIAP